MSNPLYIHVSMHVVHEMEGDGNITFVAVIILCLPAWLTVISCSTWTRSGYALVDTGCNHSFFHPHFLWFYTIYKILSRDLSYNNFTDSLPDGLSKLSRLQTLWAACAVTGHVRNEWPLASLVFHLTRKQPPPRCVDTQIRLWLLTVLDPPAPSCTYRIKQKNK